MTSTTLAGRIVDWLRAGYPGGVPRQDYVVLLGLLRRKLTDGEVREIASAIVGLAQQGEVTTVADVERLINEATLDEPSEADIARVSSHLAAGGWPLADRPF
ncbi:DUF3349 domain-containing protein [Kineococcus rhizosphaerae]|uniref:Uncharacterized protein DUF3349 n=1 Tax=Kineococcus rhizosphaerae TaxID=559628 RepID=A0A2T0R2X0_9ACTN|nr:DUF3349 domain-containing protein [Kineococcus rhizosphaerae]PRY14152.1 uncharacterized protein DUF3349 [Kineococcus rhizosphaerae]